MRYTYSYGYGSGAVNGVYLQAAAYLNSLRQRVTAESGTMVDEQATIGLYSVLIEQGLISTLRRGYSDLAAVRINDVAGTLFVQERFDLNDGTLGGASSSVNAIQSLAANQAGWSVDADTGRSQTTYDGSNDAHSVSDLGVFRNQTAGTIIAIIKDTNSAGGDTSHVPVQITGGTGTTRAGIYTRISSNSTLMVVGRRLDADAFRSSSNTFAAGYNFLAGLYVWGGNTLQMVSNGTAASSASFPSGAGSTSDTDSTLFNIGATATTSDRFPGPVSEVLIFRTVLNTTQITALRNFYRRYYPTLP